MLKDAAIRTRATVFEENSLYFCKRLYLGVGKHLPPGYRATWEQRDRLAAAKLEAELQVGMLPDSFPGVLLKSSGSLKDDDFVEVHIYGPLNRTSIERLVIGKPKKDMRQGLFKKIQNNPLGIPVDLRE